VTSPGLSGPGVWAIGECAGSPQFTHVSVDDFRIVRDNLEGGNRKTNDRLIPHVMFTDPPLARVGLSEGEAQRQGVPVRVAKLPMRRVPRTQATDETEGFMKVLVGANDDRILGFAMIGSVASEVVAAIQTAMLGDMPYTTLRDAVIAHLLSPRAWGRYSKACRRSPSDPFGVPVSAGLREVVGTKKQEAARRR
jgi:pyruvate/2-oxoglutarate dehydrogenase complex dihydrolipoamide dehydrogenase (E3) component